MYNNKYKNVIICLMIMLSSLVLFPNVGIANNQQINNKIKGIVLDSENNPLFGAVITINNEKGNQTITDKDGKFQLDYSLIDSENKLICDLIGYKSVVMTIKNSKPLTIKMDEDVALQDKNIPLIRDERPNYTIGSSAYTLTSKDLESTHVNHFGAALAGRVPGLYVTTGSSEPGAEGFNFKVRGATSTNSSSPKILVDGMQAGYNTVRIEDIESITILKDAPAVATYGMDGSNGIISIVTKTGYSGKPKISVNADYTIQQSVRTPSFINSGDYATMLNEAYRNDKISEDKMFSQSDIDHYYAGDNLSLYPNNNWYDMFKKDYVSSKNIFASVIGGSRYVKYYTSASFRTVDSPFKAKESLEDYGRNIIDIRSNVNVKLNDMISGYVKIATRVSRNYFANLDNGDLDIMNSLFDFAPTVYGPLTPDGKVVVTTDKTNSVYGKLNKSGYKKQTNLDLTTMFGLNFDLNRYVKGLSTNGNANFYTYSNSNYKAITDYERWTRDLTSLDELKFYKYGTNVKDPLSYSKGVSNNFRFEYDWNINYARTFGDHGIHANTFVKMDYYNGDNVIEDLAVYKMSYGLQTNYSYKNLLFADFVSSYIGSEQFAKNKRYGFFPSADIAFIFSNLDFLKSNSLLTYLKARLSYGIVGSDTFGDMRFLYKNYFKPDGTEVKVGNPDLTWEKSHKFNFGLDMSFLNSISASIDLFKDRRTDIPVQSGLIPSMSGIIDSEQPLLNIGEITSKGVELALGYSKSLNKDLSFNIGGNFSYYKNNVNKIGELPYTDDYAAIYRKTGYRLGQQFGYKIDYSNGNGYFNSQEEIDNSGLTYEGTSPRPGDFKYIDQNGDKVIDAKDMVPFSKTSTPQIAWGLNGLVKYKDFDLSFLVQGLAEYCNFNYGLGYYSNYNRGTFFSLHKNAWTSERYESGSRIDGPALTTNNSSSYKANDYYYQNHSFFRLKNLEIGYNLPSKVAKLIKMNGLRVYVSGYNLLTFDDAQSNDKDIENGSLTDFPTQRYYTAGVKLTF